MKRIVRGIVTCVILLLLVQQIGVCAEDEPKANFWIEKDRAELRIEDLDQAEDAQYKLLFFAQSDKEAPWVCVNPNGGWVTYEDLERYMTSEGAEVTEADGIVHAKKLAVKLFEKKNEKVSTAIELTRGSRKFSYPEYKVEILGPEEHPEKAAEEQTEGQPENVIERRPGEQTEPGYDKIALQFSEEMPYEYLYIRMEQDDTVLPLPLAEELYGIVAAESKEGTVLTLSYERGLFPEEPELYICTEKTGAEKGLILERCDAGRIPVEAEQIIDGTALGADGQRMTEEDLSEAPGGETTGGESELQTDETTGGESELQTDETTGSESELQTDETTRSESEFQSEEMTEKKSEEQAQNKSAMEQESEAKTEEMTERELETQAEKVKKADLEAQNANEWETQNGRQSESDLEAQTEGSEKRDETQMEKETERGSETQTEKVTESGAETQIETGSNQEQQTAVGTDSEVQTEGGTEIQSEEESKAQNGIWTEEKSGNALPFILAGAIVVAAAAFAGFAVLSKKAGRSGSGKDGKEAVGIKKQADEDTEDTIDPRKPGAGGMAGSTAQKEIRVQIAVINNKGRVRGNNEDSFYANGIIMPRERMDHGALIVKEFRDELQLYAVCDGMGGTDSGEDASYCAVKALADRKKEQQRLLDEKELKGVLRQISDQVYEEAYQRGQKSGTTIAMMLLHGSQAVFANVGDSRIYRFRNRELTQLSLDHSKVQRMISMGLLTPEQARKDPSRHVITQYLGMSPDVRVSPYIVTNESLQKGDIYLLCSDGLTDMVEDARIEAILQKEKKLQDAVKALFEEAMQNGGRDNTTIILVHIVSGL